MFKKDHTPVLGVIENMSGLFIKGKVDRGGYVSIEGKNPEVDSDGQFSIRIDLFKRGGGQSESERLNVPLLGEIPLAQEIMEATDAGEPIVSKTPESHVSKIYQSIAEKVMNALN
jgi:ATP-binding protein involved in chromosome partitioning